MNHHQCNDRSCPDNTVYDSPSDISANVSLSPSDSQDSQFTRQSVYPAPVSGQMQLENHRLQSTSQPPFMPADIEPELLSQLLGPDYLAPYAQYDYYGPHFIDANPNSAMLSTTGPYVKSSFNEGLPTQYAGPITAAQTALEIPRIAGQPSKRACASSSSRTRKKRKTQHPSPSIIQNSNAVPVPPQDTPEATARFETNPNSLSLTPHPGPSHHELDTIANLGTSSTYAPESTQSSGKNPSVTGHGKAVPVDPQLLSDESDDVASQQAPMTPIYAPSLQQFGSFPDEWLSRPENEFDLATLTELDFEPAANKTYSFPENVLQINEQPSDCYGPPPFPPPKNWNVSASHEVMALAESAGNVDNTTPLSHFQRNATQGVNGEVSVSAEYRSVQFRPTQPSHAEPSGVIHHTYPQEPAHKSNYPITGFYEHQKFSTNGLDFRKDRSSEEAKIASYKHFVNGFLGLKTYVNRPDPEQTSASSGTSGSDQKPASSQGTASGGGSMSGTGSSSKGGESSLERKADAKEKSALKATANRRNKSGKEEPRGQETDPDLERSSPTPNPEYVDFRARIAYKPIGWLIELCKEDWKQEEADWKTQGKKARQKRKYTESAKRESNETSAAPIQRKRRKYVPVEYHLALAGVTCPETVWVACNRFHVWRGIVFLDDGHPRDNGATILLPDEKNAYPSLENDRPFDAQEWDNDYRYAYLPEVLRPRTLFHRRGPKDTNYPREDRWPKDKYKPINNDTYKEGDLYQSPWIRRAPKRDKKWIWDEKNSERQAWCHYCDPNQKKECHLCNKKNMTNDEKDECDKETWWFSITKSRYNYHMRTRHGILPNGKHVPLAPILKKERCKRDSQTKKWMVFCIACIKWCNLTGKDPNRNKWWADIDVCALHQDGSPPSLQKSKHSDGDP